MSSVKPINNASRSDWPQDDSSDSEHFEQQFAQVANNKNDFHNIFAESYGDKYDVDTAENLRQQALNGDYSWLPRVEYVPSSTLDHAPGAYSENSGVIYLNETTRGTEAAQQTFIEEVGHHIDTVVNRDDSRGDEGQLFRHGLNGDQLTTTQIQSIQAEDDSGVISIDGEEIQVEFNKYQADANAAVGTPEHAQAVLEQEGYGDTHHIRDTNNGIVIVRNDRAVGSQLSYQTNGEITEANTKSRGKGNNNGVSSEDRVVYDLTAKGWNIVESNYNKDVQLDDESRFSDDAPFHITEQGVVGSNGIDVVAYRVNSDGQLELNIIDVKSTVGETAPALSQTKDGSYQLSQQWVAKNINSDVIENLPPEIQAEYGDALLKQFQEGIDQPSLNVAYTKAEVTHVDADSRLEFPSDNPALSKPSDDSNIVTYLNVVQEGEQGVRVERDQPVDLQVPDFEQRGLQRHTDESGNEFFVDPETGVIISRDEKLTQSQATGNADGQAINTDSIAEPDHSLVDQPAVANVTSPTNQRLAETLQYEPLFTPGNFTEHRPVAANSPIATSETSDEESRRHSSDHSSVAPAASSTSAPPTNQDAGRVTVDGRNNGLDRSTRTESESSVTFYEEQWSTGSNIGELRVEGEHGSAALSGPGYEAQGSVSARYEDGKLKAGAEGSVAVYAAKAEAEASYGPASVSAEATVGASAEGEASLTFDPAAGELGAEVGGEVHIGAKAEGEVGIGGDNGEVSVGGGVSYGLGAEFDAGATFDNGKVGVEFDVGATLGLGVDFSVDVEVDVVETVGDIGGGIKDIGKGIGGLFS